eukprot:TRINITY_DN8221_c0_g1_i3.p3 TRINITY_DN8221_c0_g1~~TRINITY_DN8221_c0_g1_i3.p3  ORF type:complete len:197 (+),score=75.10 TRINITY_DN8221_c0_g1_i3:48-638(+)
MGCGGSVPAHDARAAPAKREEQPQHAPPAAEVPPEWLQGGKGDPRQQQQQQQQERVRPSSRSAWRPEYALGVGKVDEQHQRLFELFAMLKEGETSEIVAVVAQLLDYTQYHFSMEEALMREHGYPDEQRSRHLAAHEAFIKQVTKAHFLYEHGDPGAVGELQQFLVNWLVSHTTVVDRVFTTWLLASATFNKAPPE